MPPEGWLLAAIGALSTVVGVLWRDHLRADERERVVADRSLAGWEAQVTATRALTDAIEARDRADAERRRLADR